jgi:hypothetical protein
VFSVKQTADMSGLTERTIWRMLKAGKLPHTRDKQGRVWIEERDVPERRPDLRGATGAAIEALRTQLADALERIEALEQWREARGASFAKLAPLASTPGASADLVRPPRPLVSTRTGAGLPTSGRGWGVWVEEHGGARRAGSRMWEEVSLRAWSTVEQALEGIRRRGYRPRECNDPACGCHKLLADHADLDGNSAAKI